MRYKKAWQKSPAIRPECGSGVSSAEWRFLMDAGNRAFASGDWGSAGDYFQQAVEVAEDLVALADQGRFDPACALRALANASENLSELYFRSGDRDAAANALECMFSLICVRLAWPCTSSDLRTGCCDRLDAARERLISLLERCGAPAEKISSIYLLAGRALEQGARLSAA